MSATSKRLQKSDQQIRGYFLLLHWLISYLVQQSFFCQLRRTRFSSSETSNNEDAHTTNAYLESAFDKAIKHNIDKYQMKKTTISRLNQLPHSILLQFGSQGLEYKLEMIL
jgi:hypothetical protein